MVAGVCGKSRGSTKTICGPLPAQNFRRTWLTGCKICEIQIRKSPPDEVCHTAGVSGHAEYFAAFKTDNDATKNQLHSRRRDRGSARRVALAFRLQHEIRGNGAEPRRPGHRGEGHTENRPD